MPWGCLALQFQGQEFKGEPSKASLPMSGSSANLACQVSESTLSISAPNGGSPSRDLKVAATSDSPLGRRQSDNCLSTPPGSKQKINGLNGLNGDKHKVNGSC